MYSDIQVFKFMQLFMQVFKVEPEIIFAAIIYSNRIIKSSKAKALPLVFTEYNAKGLLYASLVTATKFYMDSFEKNTIFYAIGGISKHQMRSMLDTFLDLIEFNLNIGELEFLTTMSQIKTLIAQKYKEMGKIVVHENNLRKRQKQTGVKTH